MSSVNRQDEIALRRISWTLSVSFSEIPFSSEAISYGKPVLKTENRGFNTFAGVFDPGNGRTGPAFLEFPPAIFGRGIQRRLPFLQDIILKNYRHTTVSLKSVSDAIYSKNRPHARMKRRCKAGNAYFILFSESGNTVKKSNDAPGEKTVSYTHLTLPTILLV